MDSSTRARTQQAISSMDAIPKQQRKQNVVVHNTMTATPAEDWILYPDNVMIVKNSTIRDRTTENTRRQTHAKSTQADGVTVRPMMPPTPPGSSPAQSERERAAQRNGALRCQDLRDLNDPPTSGATSAPAEVSQRPRTDTSYPYRLPTPDLSDVDEDEFWACCKNGSRRP
ncbi:MAG: hypothetical protein LQ346_006452 [Caloplaca aetnensis]|nr:MAG: hypothetical protein LQ346_006452 [Caloplaca aetnensis]